MNAAERLVELYYRQKGFFTITDVKIISGNNRQMDLLAYDGKTGIYYHIETSITNDLRWSPTIPWLRDWTNRKFFGQPRLGKEYNPKSDISKGKNYLEAIKETYKRYNIDFHTVIRVWVVWVIKDNNQDEFFSWKQDVAGTYSISMENLQVLSMRDVLEELIVNAGKANYDDDLYRCLSLIKSADFISIKKQPSQP